MPKSLQDLMQFKQVLFSPHVAGWTVESHRKLAQTIVDKVKRQYH
jgi:D-3-phosphoglycerate dehydrogenase